jgi:2-iminobutanoate/2-iminopropanoate deaminase
MPKEYLNPMELFPSLQYGFSQVVTSTGGKWIFLSGQVGHDEREHIVGPGICARKPGRPFETSRQR